MQFAKQQRALNVSLVSFFIGIFILPLWSYLLFISKTLLIYAPPIITLVGFVLGVIGLVMSIRWETRTVKGIVFASIGIVLNFFAAAASIWLLYILTYTMAPM